MRTEADPARRGTFPLPNWKPFRPWSQADLKVLGRLGIFAIHRLRV